MLAYAAIHAGSVASFFAPIREAERLAWPIGALLLRRDGGPTGPAADPLAGSRSGMTADASAPTHPAGFRGRSGALAHALGHAGARKPDRDAQAQRSPCCEALPARCQDPVGRDHLGNILAGAVRVRTCRSDDEVVEAVAVHVP